MAHIHKKGQSNTQNLISFFAHTHSFFFSFLFLSVPFFSYCTLLFISFYLSCCSQVFPKNFFLQTQLFFSHIIQLFRVLLVLFVIFGVVLLVLPVIWMDGWMNANKHLTHNECNKVVVIDNSNGSTHKKTTNSGNVNGAEERERGG